MRIPKKPPPFEQLFHDAFSQSDPGKKIAIWRSTGPATGGKYRHWDIIRHLEPPTGLTSEEWWLGIKLARQQLFHESPLLQDKNGAPFRFAPVDALYQQLHMIDRDASGAIKGQVSVLDATTRDAFYVKSLFEEAINSSQLEGAATTRQVAKQMLREGRLPRTRGEQMIYNNYQAMRFIQEIKGEVLSEQIIIELQRILTTDTLDDPSGAGRYRRPDESYRVYDEEGQLLHDPPPAETLKERMAALVEFANQEEGEIFVHPVVRAILLHFWLAYEHPFIDGNGRTARALFYWSMARQGYWLAEYVSISSILRRAPAQYAQSFLYTETDDNDLTYFIIDQLRVIQRAIQALHLDLKKKMAQIHETELLLRSNHLLLRSLNHRQLALLNHGLRHTETIYSIESHRNSNNITYQTARTDLLKLADLGLLEQFKRSRKYFFRIPADLKERINKVSIQTDRMESL